MSIATYRLIPLYNDGVTRHSVTMKCKRPVFRNGFPVACGHCVYCLKKRREEWCFRMNEERNSPTIIDTSFVTLTYDNEHLPVLNLRSKKISSWNMPDGCNVRNYHNVIACLAPVHLRIYLHKLKDYLRNKYGNIVCLRQYAVGEYGGNGWRPHYHIVFFLHYFGNIKIDSHFVSSIRCDFQKVALEFWQHCQQRHEWKNGFLKQCCKIIKPVTGYKEILYVAKYINKIDLANLGCVASAIVPEFCIISRSNEKFGLGVLGWNYIEKHKKEIFDYIEFCMKTGNDFNWKVDANGHEKPLPRSWYSAVLRMYDGYSTTDVNNLRHCLRLANESNQHAPFMVPDRTKKGQIRYISRDLGLVKEYKYIKFGESVKLPFNDDSLTAFTRSASYVLPLRKIEYFIFSLGGNNSNELVGYQDINGLYSFFDECLQYNEFMRCINERALNVERLEHNAIEAKKAHDNDYNFIE